MARTSSGLYAKPPGFDGVLKINTFVLSVTAAAICSGVTCRPLPGAGRIGTTLPPKNRTCSGKVTQYGTGSSTSSPGFSSAAHARNSASLPPTVMMICSGV